MTISKNNKKNNSYNVVAISAIAIKMSISKQYIRQCLRGDNNSISADEIRKEYYALVRKIEELIMKN